jgi:hypothetical protein
MPGCVLVRVVAFQRHRVNATDGDTAVNASAFHSALENVGLPTSNGAAVLGVVR